MESAGKEEAKKYLVFILKNIYNIIQDKKNAVWLTFQLNKKVTGKMYLHFMNKN